jgi:hypothetical protein
VTTVAKADERDKLTRASSLKLDPDKWRMVIEHRPDLDPKYPWRLTGVPLWTPEP